MENPQTYLNISECASVIWREWLYIVSEYGQKPRDDLPNLEKKNPY